MYVCMYVPYTIVSTIRMVLTTRDLKLHVCTTGTQISNPKCNSKDSFFLFKPNSHSTTVWSSVLHSDPKSRLFLLRDSNQVGSLK